jgi:hypothetical protein
MELLGFKGCANSPPLSAHCLRRRGITGAGRELAPPDAFRQDHHHGSDPTLLNLGTRFGGSKNPTYAVKAASRACSSEQFVGAMETKGMNGPVHAFQAVTKITSFSRISGRRSGFRGHHTEFTRQLEGTFLSTAPRFDRLGRSPRLGFAAFKQPTSLIAHWIRGLQIISHAPKTAGNPSAAGLEGTIEGSSRGEP